MTLYMTRVCVTVYYCNSVCTSVGDYRTRACVCVCEVGLAQLTFNPRKE